MKLELHIRPKKLDIVNLALSSEKQNRIIRRVCAVFSPNILNQSVGAFNMNLDTMNPVMTEVPICDTLRSGYLSSGVAYFVQPNECPDDVVELRLVVNVGSLNENDEEQGLAHFVEHLGFKGTKSFEQYELVKVLQSLGLSYGADLNASTHLLETKYTLCVTRSKDDLSQLTLGIKILSEWAFHMTIKDSDVIEERSVISSEFLAKKGVNERLLTKYWNAIFMHDKPMSTDSSSFGNESISEYSSLIAKRMPIGLPEIFMNADSECIRKFYRKHYIPSNISVVIVGALNDTELDGVLSELENSFKYEPSAESLRDLSNEKPPVIDMNRLLATVHYETKTDVVVSMIDSELTSAHISFEFFIHYKPSKSKEFIRMNILRRLLTSIVDQRFNCLCKRNRSLPDGLTLFPISDGNSSPFLGLGISMRELVRGLLCTGITATLKTSSVSDSTHSSAKSSADTIANSASSQQDVGIELALKSILLEMRRFADWGVNGDELEAAKQKWKQLFVHNRDHPQTTSSSSIAADLVDHVLNRQETVFCSPREEARLSIEALDSIGVEDMNDMLRSLDMHIPSCNSRYYNGVEDEMEVNGSPKCSFRVLSAQFPNSNCLPKPYQSSPNADIYLRQLLANAQEYVAALESTVPWPNAPIISEIDIISAAKVALASSCPVGSEVETESGEKSLALPAVPPLSSTVYKHEQGCICGCADGNFSFLPSNLNLCSPISTRKLVKPVIERNRPPDASTLDGTDRVISSVTGITLPDIDAYEFTLPNGMKVCCKWTRDINPGKISMQGYALGGSTELSEVEDAIFTLLDSMASHSHTRVGLLDNNAAAMENGVEGLVFSGKDIGSLQSVTKTNINTQRHFYHRGIGGSCASPKIELLLALLVLKFTSQCINERAYADMIDQQLSMLEHVDNSPEYAFMNRARVLTFGDIAICRPLTKEVVKAATYQTAVDLYAHAFLADPTEFKFVFVGDLPEKLVMQRLLATSIGLLQPRHDLIKQYGGLWTSRGLRNQQTTTDSDSISCARRSLPFHSVDSFKIEEKVHESIELRMSDKASKLIAFRIEWPDSINEIHLVSIIMLDAACKILQIRLLEELRVRLGIVYSLVVESSMVSLSPVSTVSVVMHCCPEDVHIVKKTVEETIVQLQQEGPCDSEIRGVVETMCRTHKMALKNSSHWLFWILDSYKAFDVLLYQRQRYSSTEAQGGLNHVDGSTHDETLSESSSKWVNQHCHCRGYGKPSIIEEQLTVENLTKAYRLYFILNKSIHLDLCPKASTKVLE